MQKKQYEKPIITIIEIESEILLENSGEVDFNDFLGFGYDEDWANEDA